MVFNGQVIQFVIGILVDSLKNTMQAFMWPLQIVQYQPPIGPIALGVAFWLFPIYAKPWIETWLFDEDGENDAAAKDAADDA